MLYGQRYEKLRHVLKEVRREAGLTQVQLAEALGKGQSYVSKVERGEQYLDAIELLEWFEACGANSSEIIKKI
ncbi:DNA-binding protein [Burkholderia vietnamiensis]|uniref:helix-turn-helix domain-containing protein n=1 Tax=Burkholderia vietnamiensis TaxID=60552 RepID=UPI000755247E|nr:helix-turn-helix transcriptional regulator [Burkholderia vietnamiensis]KVR74299.1 DNA-binding protein [Burkholderia vietnamiensis]